MQKHSSMTFQTGVLATLALLLCLGPARAGDPIQVPTDKAKQAPVNNRPVHADIFKSWNRPNTPSAGSKLNSLTPFITPGRPDVREEKRLKNERIEKKNWMLLEPGELQRRDDEEEAKFGGKAFSMENIDDDQAGNYLFHGLADSQSDRAKNAQRTVIDTEEPGRKVGPREVEGQGVHTASELNLKGLINPGQANAANLNKNEATLFQFFKDNALPAPDRNQQARDASFREFINGPQGAAPSGISDPINFRPDLTQERMNPILPNRPALDLAPAKPAEAFSAKPVFGGAGAFNPAPGLPEIGNTKRLPQGQHLPSHLLMQEPTKAPRATVGGGNGSLFNRDTPRRGGL